MPADAPHVEIPCSESADLLASLFWEDDLIPAVRQISDAENPLDEFNRLLPTAERRRRFMKLLTIQSPREKNMLEVVLDSFLID